MAERILIYFNDAEHGKLEKLLNKQEKETGKRNASKLIKDSVFGRRERKKMIALSVEDLVFRSQVKSKAASILGDLRAGRDVTLSVKELEKLAAGSLNKI
jgi:hypothetical protein